MFLFPPETAVHKFRKSICWVINRFTFSYDQCLESIGSAWFGFLDPDPQKYADPRQNINNKNSRQIFYSQSKSEPSNKEIIKVTLFVNGWFIKFYYNENKQQKSYKKNLNSALLKIHRYRNIPNNYIINTTINLVIIIIMYWSSRSIPNNYTINTTINWVIIIILYWSSRSIPNKYTIKKTINQKSYQGHKLIEITRRRLGWLIYCLQKYTSTFFV